MAWNFNITNPGFYIDGLLTSVESQYVTDLVLASSSASENEVLTWKSGAPSWEAAASVGGYTNLTQFVDQTPWRVFYSNGSGDVTELALGADGTYLKSNGASAAPSFAAPSGSGDVVGPAGAVDSNFASFNTTTGKLIKDSGSKASDFATAGHNHAGVYEPADATILKDADIGVSVAAQSHNHAGVYAPALGADDNYVTDAEKTAIGTIGNKIDAIADPNADRILFWDDSAGAYAYLTASTGLTISTTNMTVRTSSATQTGIVELATDAEAVTGTDTARAVTPANLTARLAAPGAIGGTTPAAGTFTTITGRVTPRVSSETSSATPTINTDNVDAHSITALATAITSMTTNLSGTPTNFQKLIIRIKDNGTARAITWGASFEAKGVALPTTTVISKVLTVGFIYDTVTSKWGCVASVSEA